MGKERKSRVSPEERNRAWPSGSPEDARDSAVAHLEAFVGLTTKGFLLVAAVAVGVVVEAKNLNILGVPVPAGQAASLVYILFIALFVAIAIHALNVYMATLSLTDQHPEQWISSLLSGAGVLNPLACWPGKLGLIIGCLSFGLPFALWWSMDIAAWRLFEAETGGSMYPLRYAFILSGIGVGILVGASYVRIYSLVRSRAELLRQIRTMGIAKWVGATICSWIGYSASILITDKAIDSPFQLVDIAVAYPLIYAIPAWGLVPIRWLLWAGGAGGIAAAGALRFGQVDAFYATAGVASAALTVGVLRRRKRRRHKIA